MARKDRPTDESASERQDRLTRDEYLEQEGGKAAAPRKRSTGKKAAPKGKAKGNAPKATTPRTNARGKAAPKRRRAPAGGEEEPSHEDIQRRAYEIWEQKGREGEPEEHWRLAEEELARGATAAGETGRNE